jgi:hypothetical protein
MRGGLFFIILHSPFSIINSWVTEEDFEKAAGAKKVMILDGGREKGVLTLRSSTWQATLSWRFRKIDSATERGANNTC